MLMKTKRENRLFSLREKFISDLDEELERTILFYTQCTYCVNFGLKKMSSPKMRLSDVDTDAKLVENGLMWKSDSGEQYVTLVLTYDSLLLFDLATHELKSAITFNSDQAEEYL